MIQGNRILAFIPARGGSKGIPNKNIIDLCGKPLIAYTIEAALMSKYVDSVVVSTDSERIAEISRDLGASIPFMRPESLAGDKATTIDVVTDALERFNKAGNEYDILLLLQPTSPLRTVSDIDSALDTFIEHGLEPLVSVCDVNDHPILMRTIEDGRLIRLMGRGSTIRRQDMPDVLRVNGAIYIIKTSDIRSDTSFNDSIIPYVMPRERSIDIDEPIDLIMAEALIMANK